MSTDIPKKNFPQICGISMESFSFGPNYKVMRSLPDDICNTGIGCGNVLFSQIGDNKKGVCLSRCADLLDEENWQPGHVGVIVVFKCSLKIVKEIENDRCQVTRPSLGYNGHVSWNWRLYNAFEKTQPAEKCSFSHYELYYASQYYFYEFHDADGMEECVPTMVPNSTCIMYPTHVLPYAVVNFKYQASILNNSPSQCKPCFKVWEGDLVHTYELSEISVCLKSFKHVVTPVALENFNVTFEPMEDFIGTHFLEGNISTTSAMELDYFKMIGSDDVFKRFIETMKNKSEIATQAISDQVMVMILPSCKFTINMAIEDCKNFFCPESNLHCFILFKKPLSSKDRFNNLRNWISSPNNAYKIAESKKKNEKENVSTVSMEENLAMSPQILPGLQPEKVDVTLLENTSPAYKAESPQLEDVEMVEEVTKDDFRLYLSSDDEDTVDEIYATPVKCEVSALNTETSTNTDEGAVNEIDATPVRWKVSALNTEASTSTDEGTVNEIATTPVSCEVFALNTEASTIKDEDTVNEIDTTPVSCEVSALNTEASTSTVEELLSASFIFKDELIKNVAAEDTSIKELVSKLIDDVLIKEAEHQEIQPLRLACRSSDPENDDFKMIMLTSVPNSKTIDCEHYSRGNWIKLKSTEDKEKAALKISFLKINNKWMVKNGDNSPLAKNTKQVKNGSRVANRKRKFGQSSPMMSATDDFSESPRLFINHLVDQNKASPLNVETLLVKNRSPVKTIVSSNLPTADDQSSFQVSKSFDFANSFLSQKEKTRDFLRVFNVSANGQSSIVENASGEPTNLTIKSREIATKLNSSNISTKETIIEQTDEVQAQIKLLGLSRKEESIGALDYSIRKNKKLIEILNGKLENCEMKNFASGSVSTKPRAENWQETVLNLDILKNLRDNQTDPRKKARKAEEPKKSQKFRMGPNKTIKTDNDLDFSRNCKKVKHSHSGMTSSDRETSFKKQVTPSNSKSNLTIKNFHHPNATSKNVPGSIKTQSRDISTSASIVNENEINGLIQKNEFSVQTNNTQKQNSANRNQCFTSSISGNSFIRNESVRAYNNQEPDDQRCSAYLNNTGGKQYDLQQRNIVDQPPTLNLPQPVNIPLQQSNISGDENVNLRHENFHFANIIEQPRNYVTNPPNYLFNYPANLHSYSANLPRYVHPPPYYRPPVQSSLNNYIRPNGNIYMFQSNRFAIINNNCDFSCSTSRLNDGISQMCSSMVSPTTPSQQSPYLSHSECLTFSESELEIQMNSSSYPKVNYLLDINSPLSPPNYPPSSQLPPLPTYPAPAQPPPPLPTYPAPTQPLPPPPVFSMEENVADDFNVREMELDSSSQEDDVEEFRRMELSISEDEVE